MGDMPQAALRTQVREIPYEQPLHERVRTFLRLEFLFQEARHSVEGDSPWDSRSAVASLIEIISLLGRGDLRTEVIKELERHGAMLGRLADNPGVDDARLRALLGDINERIEALHDSGSFAHPFRNHEFLNTVKQRSSIPGGTCEFDLPAFHFWLSQPPARRRADLESWMEMLEPLRRALRLILNLVRNSAAPSEETAPAGMFQRTLDSHMPCHLIRVLLPEDAPWYPEISGSKHRFTVRFLDRHDLATRGAQTSDDVRFRLVCCVF